MTSGNGFSLQKRREVDSTGRFCADDVKKVRLSAFFGKKI